MPFPGTRINQETVPLNAGDMPGVASYYEVKFTDTNKPNGQIWAGVVGSAHAAAGTPRGQRAPERWFVVWLGTANNPVPKGEAATLGAVDPAVDAAASAAAGSQRASATCGRHECTRPEPERRCAGSG